jgi:hypothetical protein
VKSGGDRGKRRFGWKKGIVKERKESKRDLSGLKGWVRYWREEVEEKEDEGVVRGELRRLVVEDVV